MIDTHRTATASMRTVVFRLIAAFALAAACACTLSACGHEPEIATPPADDGQTEQQNQATEPEQDATAEGTDAQTDESQDAASDEAADAAAQEEEQAKQEEEPPAHEGPYVISILNAGGADGLAGAAQEALAADGIEGNDYEISLDSYLGGMVPETTVYVTGEGDDAEAVRAEADKVAEALGAQVQTFNARDFVEGTTMDGLDILVLVGANAVQ